MESGSGKRRFECHFFTIFAIACIKMRGIDQKHTESESEISKAKRANLSSFLLAVSRFLSLSLPLSAAHSLSLSRSYSLALTLKGL